MATKELDEITAGEEYDRMVEQGITAALEAFKLLGLTPLEIFQASRSISLGVAAKAKAESGRREL